MIMYKIKKGNFGSDASTPCTQTPTMLLCYLMTITRDNWLQEKHKKVYLKNLVVQIQKIMEKHMAHNTFNQFKEISCNCGSTLLK